MTNKEYIDEDGDRCICLGGIKKDGTYITPEEVMRLRNKVIEE